MPLLNHSCSQTVASLCYRMKKLIATASDRANTVVPPVLPFLFECPSINIVSEFLWSGNVDLVLGWRANSASLETNTSTSSLIYRPVASNFLLVRPGSGCGFIFKILKYRWWLINHECANHTKSMLASYRTYKGWSALILVFILFSLNPIKQVWQKTASFDSS